MAECVEDTAMEPELILDTVKVEPESKESLCRLCACNSELLIPIFEGEGLENTLADKIEKYLPIQVTLHDDLPLQVCFHCASTLISWHEMTTTCMDAEHKLKDMFCDTVSEGPVSPGVSRDYDADLCDVVPDTMDLETSGHAASDNQNTDKGPGNQGQEKLNSRMEAGESLSGETERCLLEVKLEGISEKLMCQICSALFTDTSSLGNHIKEAHAQHSLLESGGTMFSCHLCSASCLTETERDGHLQCEHGVSLKDGASVKPDISQNCQFCGRFFRHVSVLNMHSISCKKLLGNSESSEDYSDYVTLDESITFDEPPGTREKSGAIKRCVAKRSFNSSSAVLKKGQIEAKVSKKNLTPMESETITVPKRTRQSRDSSEKRVSCAYCIKSFSGRYEAIAHVSKLHQNKLEEFLVWLQRRKLYLKDKLCSICDKTFTSTQEATEHVQNCHKEGTKELFKCELCLIELCDELELLKHIANHSASNGGSKFFFEMRNTETENSSISDLVVSNESPSLAHYARVKCENTETCADVKESSCTFIKNTADECNARSVSTIMETCIYSNVPQSQNPSRGACFDSNLPTYDTPKMDRTDLLIDSLLNDKEIIQFKTISEVGPCYPPHKNSGSCNLDLPLLIDDSSTEKSDIVNSMTQLVNLSSTEGGIVDQRTPTPPL